jgi:hypothetical protein
MARAKLREERVSRVCPAGAGRERLAARSQPVIARADKGERALRGTHDFVIGTIRREAVPGARVVDIGDDEVDNPVEQHISSFTIDRYRFLLARGGLAISRIETDQAQSSSRVLYWLAPLIRWNARRIWGQSSAVDVQNSRNALLGRKLLIVAEKAAT